MKIKKIGHCCLVIEIATANGLVRLMTDPGVYSKGQTEEKNIDAVFITHEHSDHFHIDSVRGIIANNPQTRVFTNTAVGKLLEKEGIPFQLLENGAQIDIKGVLIGSKDEQHAEIYRELPRVQNTGYFIFDPAEQTFFYPGDTFMLPGQRVDILALPVSAPWMKVSESIDYALAVKPRVAFPVHDAILSNPEMGSFAPKMFLPKHGIEFVVIPVGGEATF